MMGKRWPHDDVVMGKQCPHAELGGGGGAERRR